MVINPDSHDDRLDIHLETCWFSYVKEYVYLGVMFSDSGVVHNDLDLHVRDKNKSVFIKLANFIRNQAFAPVTVKVKVLKACMRAALLYGHEAWGSSPLSKIETLFRKAIRVTFSIHNNAPNEIVYLETSVYALSAEIYRSQYKFWSKVKQDIENDPDSSIAKVYNAAIRANVHFLRHYIKLHSQFQSCDECFDYYRKEFIDNTLASLQEKETKVDNIVHRDYVALTNDVTPPAFYTSYVIIESDRVLLTKYRTGSHHLKMLAGSRYNTPRDRRLCKCKMAQSLHHVIFDCIYTNSIRTQHFRENIRSLHDFFTQDHKVVANWLMIIEAKLKLR